LAFFRFAFFLALGRDFALPFALFFAFFFVLVFALERLLVAIKNSFRKNIW